MNCRNKDGSCENSNICPCLLMKPEISNEQMIENIKIACGDYSISYYNISNYKNADNFAVSVMYEQMLERERKSIQDKIDDLKEKLEIIERFQREIKAI